MNASMTTRYNDRHRDRQVVHQFVEFLRSHQIHVMGPGALRPVELTPMDISRQIDAWQGVDRAQLAAERQAQLQPGMECACRE